MTTIEYIRKVAAAALDNFDGAMQSLGLAGVQRKGKEFLPLNPNRADHKPGSFSINTTSGAWSDFATDQKGGDLVSLASYVWSEPSQSKAAEKLSEAMGLNIDPPKRAAGARKARGDTSTHPVKSKPPASTTKSAATDAGVCVMPVPDDVPAPTRSHPLHGKPSQRYAYLTASGAVNFYQDRYEAKQPGERKQFAPLTLWRSETGKLKWQFKAAPEPRPLYGLDRLREGFPVLVVEGERCADEAHALLADVFDVLSWPGGGQAVDKADWSYLAGRNVLIWPDCDAQREKLSKEEKAAGVDAESKPFLPETHDPKKGQQPGIKAAECIAAQLERHGAKTRIVVIPAPGKVASGWDVTDAIAEGWNAERIKDFLRSNQRAPDLLQHASVQTSIQAPDVGSPKSEARRRYFLSESDGVYVVEPTKSGDAYCAPRVICDRLEVLALARDPSNGGWGLLVEFADRDNVKHRLVIPARSFNGEGLEATGLLYDKGLYIEPGGRRAVLDYLQTQSPEKRARTTNRTGWHGEGDDLLFVLPDGAIGTATDEWLFDSGAPDASPFKQRGTLSQWRDNVASLCAGNSRLVFAVSTAFAAPLLHLIGEESGGFQFTGNSSNGKTTALRAAASVCGSPDYMQRWRASDNGVEAMAMTHCDAPLLLDELKQIDGKVAGETAYMLSNSSGKARANQNGGARSIARWRLIFLSAGELSLSQHMADVGKKIHAGQELRMADIPADAGAGLGCFEQLHGKAGGHEFANALAAAMGKYYGTAFPYFVKHALTERERLSTSLREAQTAFEKAALTNQASGQARRAAARFALVGAAGEFAIDWGITGWNPGEAMKAAQVCFAAWLGSYGGEGNQEQRAMLKQVRRFLESHGEARFADFNRPVADDDHAPRVINKAGWRKHDKIESQTEYYVYSEVFKAEVCQGLDYKAVARLLIDKGYMRADGKHLQPKVSLPGESARRVFHILPTIWSEENA